MASKSISISSQECHISAFFTYALTDQTNKKILVKFAYRIDGEGHVDRVLKVSDLYTSSDVGGHSQSSELVILKVVCGDVAVSTNKEAIVQEEIKDDTMISSAATQEGARETDGGRGNPVKRVKRDMTFLEGTGCKLSINIGKHSLSVECLWRERVIDDDDKHTLTDHVWVVSDGVAIRETFKSSHHSEKTIIIVQRQYQSAPMRS